LEEVFPELVITQVMDIPSSSSKKENKIINPDENQNDISAEKKNSTVSKKMSDNRNEREEFKGINYMGLISILTEGIKEQQTQIEDLKAKNEDLEKRLSLIEALLKKQ
ncbi:MAG: hypothetical protein EBS55_06065, partial [Flavobacteriaceae bacterium]|nr:hypothetical protein [Flavobacteriaceae bacterium]